MIWIHTARCTTECQVDPHWGRLMMQQMKRKLPSALSPQLHVFIVCMYMYRSTFSPERQRLHALFAASLRPPKYFALTSYLNVGDSTAWRFARRANVAAAVQPHHGRWSHSSLDCALCESVCQEKESIRRSTTPPSMRQSKTGAVGTHRILPSFVGRQSKITTRTSMNSRRPPHTERPLSSEPRCN